MPIRSVALKESTAEQRYDFARNFLNLEVHPADAPDAILSKIEAAQPGVTNIFVQEADTPEQHAATETAGEAPLTREEAHGKMAGSLGKGDPRAVIMIPVVETQDGSGTRDVLVGVNGRAWQLQRGHDLSVPWRVVEALKNAVATIVTHRNDEGHEGEVEERNANRIAFNIVARPSDAEIEEWSQRTSAEFCV